MPPNSELARQWFVPGEGIDRHVIVTDIQRYLGNDATVRPGKGTGENEVSTPQPSRRVFSCLHRPGNHRLLDQSVSQPHNCMPDQTTRRLLLLTPPR